METVKLSISGMTCGHCVSSVRAALDAVPGVQVQNVRIGSAELRVDAAQTPSATDAALEAVQDAGYEATVDTTATAAAESASASGSCCAPRVAAVTPLTVRHPS